MQKNVINKIGSIAIALLVWQIASVIVGYDFLLASPLKTLSALINIVASKEFISTVLFSAAHICLGFTLAFVLGFVLALLAGKYKVLETLLWPYMITIKTVPVASFIVLALFWMNSRQLPSFISFLTVLPVIYNNILTGYKKTDTTLLEAASVFGADWIATLKTVFIPQIEPYIYSAISIGCGMAFKSGIAAEVIAVASGSIGEQIYMTKVYFAMDELFAWTVVIILCSFIFEKVFFLLCQRLLPRLERL